ncbi:activating signal cointegrator 1 complex subunit 1 isoform X2 [Sitophilus oryzae]|nr:activating signal cointegrator 1 complex subunit 1 isoform X2 [Sitophilus oryzae]
MSRKHFPDFFTNKGPIPTTVTPLQFGKMTYYQSRVNPDKDEYGHSSKPNLKPYTDNDDEMLVCEDIEDSYDITLTKNGKFFTSLYVPSKLLSYIIGAKGVKLKSLQRDTNTIIKVPRMNEKGEVTITGESERKVASARAQIAMIVAQRKERMQPTHFIAIPIVSDTINENLIQFKNEIMENPPAGVTESLFQNPVKLHLTIVMLKILDEDELDLAKKNLQTCYNESIAGIYNEIKGNEITVQGVEIMNDDPANVYVLYGKVKMPNDTLLTKLQNIADALNSYFCRVGIAKKEYEKVKLHMTLMNTSFRKGSEGKGSFDATDILQKYRDFYFGSFELKELHLCIRGTTTADDGAVKYYDTASVISL